MADYSIRGNTVFSMKGWHGHAYRVIHYKTLQTFKGFIMPYCVSEVVFYLESIPALLERPVRGRYGNRQNSDFRPLLLRTTYSSTGRAMIHTPSLYPLPCARSFLKMNAENEANLHELFQRHLSFKIKAWRAHAIYNYARIYL